MTYQEAFDLFVSEWGYSYGDVASGDCNDTRSDVHPLPNSVDNTWYDAHDQHCTGLNDFDQDGDGYSDVMAGAP